MRTITIGVLMAAALWGATRTAWAQPDATAGRATVMIVVENNRSQVTGRELRAAVNRALPLLAVPGAFPRATDAEAWIAVTPAGHGRIAMRIRRRNGRGASRVESLPERDVLPWLVEGVRWLMAATEDTGARADASAEASDDGGASRDQRATPAAAPSTDARSRATGTSREHPANHNPPMADRADFDRDLAERRGGGARGLAQPRP